MRTYRVGIIGLGRMGSTICDEVAGYEAFRLPYSVAGACRASDRLELACGCDLLADRREAFRSRWGCQALYEDYLEMIRLESPDMVAVCTAGPNHAELACACAEAGVPMMYLEKAMACSMQEADAVRAAVERNGTVFNTAVLRRFSDRYQKVRDMVRQGAIGQPRAVIQRSGGSLLHSNIHAVDFAMFMLGDPTAVRVKGELAAGTVFDANRLDHDPDAIYRVEFADGAQAWQVPWGNYDVDIQGTEGAIHCLNNGMDVVVRRREQPPLEWPRHVPYVAGIPLLGSATVACLEDLVEAHETGRPTLNPIEVAHHSTEICLACAESHRTGGGWVTLPLANRELYVAHV